MTSWTSLAGVVFKGIQRSACVRWFWSLTIGKAVVKQRLLYSFLHAVLPSFRPFSFFADTGQGNLATTSSTMVAWLDYVNQIFKTTTFGSNVGSGIQVRVAQVSGEKQRMTQQPPLRYMCRCCV